MIRTVLAELTQHGFTTEDLFRGRMSVHSTVDERVQTIVNDALEHGLALYEQRWPHGAADLPRGDAPVYERQLAGPVPQFPREIEHRIDQYLMRRAALGRACLDDGTPGSSVNLIQKENEP